MLGAANMAGVMTASAVGTERGLLVNVLDDEWDRILVVNVTGMKNCLRAELQHMNPNGGSIVNAGSVSGLVGSPFNAAYGASKAAVMSLSVSVAQEMGRKGIRVNAIAP
jgi:NAD(P)-dependent dehydrogenase (short-subunit alcohol dehydrogenase family)